ncbi:MAG: precorrin-6y C5,15-methyltransferase (decarboxylating) subunit CbiE [Methylocystis sp.]
MTQRWLSLIGIGEDGALTPAARALIDDAALIVGGSRHLALIGATSAARMQWPSPFTIDAVLARRGEKVVVLASGDPFFYGVGELISRHVAPDEMFCMPSPSAFAFAASRLCWSQQDCALLSLHGRAFERITPHFQPGRRLLVLSWDGTTPALLAEHLTSRGFGESVLHVLENLGGPRELARSARAASFALTDIGSLNTVGVELVAAPGARVIPLTPGLPDEWFEHDGQITKRDIRAVTLAALAPRKGELLWDIGAGSGSIGIEWMLADPANRAIAIEADPARAARIARNASSLGVPDLDIIMARAPEGLAGLALPDAIFVGGGADARVLDIAWEALPQNGRIVVNAVTLETQSLLAQAFNEHGGDLAHVQIARARAVGRFHALDPAMPVLQWRAVKR